MRTVLISLATVAAMLAGCSKAEENRTPAVPDATSPIALTAGVQLTTESRAPVVGTTFPADAPDVFGVTAFADPTAAPSTDWSATPYINNVSVNSGVASALTFASNQYYPANGDKVYFYAYAPAVSSLTAGTSSSAPIAAYTIDGQQDIMAAQLTTGIAKVSSGQAQPQPALSFTHKLMQLRFKVVADASYFESGKSKKVTEVLVKNVKNSAKLFIGDGALAFDDAVADKTFTLPITAGTKDEITLAGTEMDHSVMCEPLGAAGEVMLKITADGVVYDNIVVILAGTNSGMAGTSHLITLTFKRSGIAPTATITDWADTGKGSTDIGGDGKAYPYIVNGNVIVSKDGNGSTGQTYHAPWSAAAMPWHCDPDDSRNAISAVFQVAKQDCNSTNTPEVPVESSNPASPYSSITALRVCAKYKEDSDQEKGKWRLPTLSELKYIYDMKDKLSGITPFSADKYRSSSIHDVMTYDWWYYTTLLNINFADGKMSEYDNSGLVRCVRDQGVTKYPYIKDGSIIVSKDAVGSASEPFHANWTTTPEHLYDDAENSCSAKFDVAQESCNITNSPGVTDSSGSGKYYWNDVAPACAAYSQPDGAAGTWRLPTIIELTRILNVHKELTLKEPIKSEPAPLVMICYASATKYQNLSNSYGYFAGYQTLMDMDNTHFFMMSASKVGETDAYFVRCVRDL